jgi:endo-1,4-beta-D-glucanase Y
MLKPSVIGSMLIAIAGVYAINAAILPYINLLPHASADYDSILVKTWNGIKKRNIDPYQVKLVHRPKSELPGDAVSEGVGYGMLCALYCDDQATFNTIWDEAESRMWQGGYYNWRVDKTGNVIGTGAATDAEEDIALSLIFADCLVKKSHWSQHSSPKNATYSARAQSMINSIWTNMVAGGRYIDPGAQWSYGAFVNPGYFAPAYYRVFGEFETTHHDWASVIDQCYKTIQASPGYANGLIPDWMTPDGKYVTSSTLGYNTYADGKSMYKDAIRCLWRVATDYLWYSDPRALEYLTNAFNFIKTPDRAGFYQMSGALVPAADTFTLGNGVTRSRREFSHLIMGMWAPVGLCCGTPRQADTFSSALLGFYTTGADYWGRATDPAGSEDTLHNEMYFDQFLAWFGASLMGGVFTDLWEDFKDPDPGLPLAWKSQPVVDTNVIDANVKPLHLRASFNKPASWTVTLVYTDSGKTVFSATGSADTIDFSWTGASADGKPAPTGRYTVTITARGLSTPFLSDFWFGRTLALMTAEGLLVDDFRDGDLKPFIGNVWQSYLDSYEGKAGQSSIPRLEVAPDPSGGKVLAWEYLLKKGNLGFNGYAALEWNAGVYSADKSYSGLQSIIVYAKTSKVDSFSLQLITSDITDYNYFEDSLISTTGWKAYTFPISGFRHRFGGGTAAPDLSKLTAIRLQKQGPDGSQNTLFVQRVLFKGSLDNIYQNPPPFVSPDTSFFIGVKGERRMALPKTSWMRLGGDKKLMITSPDKKASFTFALSSLTGKKVMVRKSELSVMIIDCSGLGKGVFVATLQTGQANYSRRILMVR